MEDLVRRCRTPKPTVLKAIKWLNDEAGARIEYCAQTRRRFLADPTFVLPLLDPEADDVTALVIACALLGPLVEPSTRRRLERLVEDLDERQRQRGGREVPLLGWVTTGVTMATSRVGLTASSTTEVIGRRHRRDASKMV